MFTDTSFGLFDWLQMEDIYSNIFVLKCQRYNENVSGRLFLNASQIPHTFNWFSEFILLKKLKKQRDNVLNCIFFGTNQTAKSLVNFA